MVGLQKNEGLTQKRYADIEGQAWLQEYLYAVRPKGRIWRSSNARLGVLFNESIYKRVKMSVVLTRDERQDVQAVQWP